MKIEKLKSIIIFVAIVCPIMFTCLFLIFTGTVTLFLHGFAVDSYGKLYLGKDSKIEVYDNSVLDYTISSMTSRGYAFTIQADDTILLSTSTIVYTLDLHGNVLNEEEDVDTKVINSLEKRKKIFYSSNGDKYILKSPWGRTEIVLERDDDIDIIYQMPILDYVVRIVMLIVFVCFFIFIPMIITDTDKELRESIKSEDNIFRKMLAVIRFIWCKIISKPMESN